MTQYSTTVKVVGKRYQEVLHWLERDWLERDTIQTTVKVVGERYQEVLHWLERDTIQYYCEGCRKKRDTYQEVYQEVLHWLERTG